MDYFESNPVVLHNQISETIMKVYDEIIFYKIYDN